MKRLTTGLLILAVAGCGKIKPAADAGDDTGVPDGADAADGTDGVDVPDGGDADVEPTTCTTDEDCDDGDPCTDDTCLDGEVCTYEYNTDSCSDGFDCTTGDTCDGAGNCVPTSLDDSACGTGELCRPECFPATGCGTPPASLVVDCPDTVTLPATASCTITLDGLADQVECIDCTTGIGPVTLSSDDFADSSGACGMSGWSLVTGDNCLDRIDDGGPCTPGGGVRTCCSDISTIATTIDGDCRLRTDRGQNCSADEREWRMERTFDTSDLMDVEVCFNISEDGATDNEGVLLYAEDTTHSEQVFCLQDGPAPGGPVNLEWPYCVTLPTWCEDNPALGLLFIMHSHDGGDRLYIDDVVVRGLPSCMVARSVAFEEDFDPCPGTTIPDGWNGWSVTGSPRCTDVCTGAGGARAQGSPWTMSHTVDTSGLDADVRLCFDVGDAFASTGNDWIRVSFDAGSGWQDAWYWERNWSFGGVCSRVCLLLSDMHPAAARNPALGIRFQLSSDDTDMYVYIDDVVVDGVVNCDGSGSLRVDPPSDDGGGTYTVEVEDTAGTQMWAEVTCSWDTPPDPITGSDTTWFQP